MEEKSGEAKRRENTLKTTATSLEILDALKRLNGLRLTTLAEELDTPPSTIHSHLSTLAENQFVVKEDQIYHLGPRLLQYGRYVRTRKEGYELARRYVEKIHEDTGRRTIFAANQGGRGVFMHNRSGDQRDWPNEGIGNLLYLHNTAVGKAMLAKMPDYKIDAIIDKWGLPKETDNTITKKDRLLSEMKAIRRRGYAINCEENIQGLFAIGVAVTDETDTIIGGFSVSGPANILPKTGTNELVNRLIQEADDFELELRLGED
jgi:DNA-binding IclR family transcriptional regulator